MVLNYYFRSVFWLFAFSALFSALFSSFFTSSGCLVLWHQRINLAKSSISGLFSSLDHLVFQRVSVSLMYSM